MPLHIPIWYLHICILEMSKSVIRKLFSIFQFLCLSLCIIVFLFSYFSLQNNIYECKRRRKFWVKRQVTDSTNIEHWLLTRQKLSGKFIFKICTYYQFLIYVNWRVVLRRPSILPEIAGRYPYFKKF